MEENERILNADGTVTIKLGTRMQEKLRLWFEERNQLEEMLKAEPDAAKRAEALRQFDSQPTYDPYRKKA